MIKIHWKLVNDCWKITSHKTSDPRGRVLLGKPAIMGHRFMYMQKIGPIPKGIEVCHKCDNPWCVNPDHLFLGTHSENMQDMVKKGGRNHPIGEHHPNSKLSEADVIQINKSKKSQKKLASIYGVTRGTIAHIQYGRNWSWLTKNGGKNG